MSVPEGGMEEIGVNFWGVHLRVDKDSTMLLRKIGDYVGAISREPGFG